MTSDFTHYTRGCAVLGAALALVASGCKPSSFSGSSASNTVTTQNDGGSATNAATASTCTAAGSTQVKLLTPSITNGEPQNFLAYEVFVTDCSGNRKVVEAKAILFDLDAFLLNVAESQPLTYVVKSTEAQAAGSLIRVANADLFGRTGSAFFHYETDRPFTLATTASSVTISIQMAGRTFKPYAATTTGSDHKMQTYLRFGEAAPVTSVVAIRDKAPQDRPQTKP